MRRPKDHIDVMADGISRPGALAALLALAASETTLSLAERVIARLRRTWAILRLVWRRA